MARLAAAALCMSVLAVPVHAQSPVGAATDARSAILAADDGRVTTQVERAVVGSGLTHDDPEVRGLAVRAIGRTRRAEFLAQAIAVLSDGTIDVRREAAFAVAHIGSEAPGAFAAAEAALRAALQRERDARAFSAFAEEYGRLPFGDEVALEAAAGLLRSELVRMSASPTTASLVDESVARGAEALARRAVRLKVRPAALIALLRMQAEFLAVTGSRGTGRADAESTLRRAVSGLLMLVSAEDSAVDLALQARDAQVRRLGVIAIAKRPALTASAALPLLKDDAVLVRHAVAASIGPKLPEVARAALDDSHVHVRLAALKALGEARACREACSSRLAAIDAAGAAWHEPAAALVALARTDVDTARPFIARAAGASPSQVRMYAARAAAFTRQGDVLERLARDADVNVRHAALVGWREAGLPGLVDAATAALASDDGQLLLEAAAALKGAPATPALVERLRKALHRMTAQRRETSRDPRLALLERIDELDAGRVKTLRPYLSDFDPAVAARAAELLNARLPADQTRPTARSRRPWSTVSDAAQIGQALVAAAPRPLPHAAVPTWDAVTALEATSVTFTLTRNRTLTLRLFARNAPTAVSRFVAQEQAGEWNGRTLHRVEPGFVVQGGSPAANEYAGAAAFARDEFSSLSHVRGTVGISTRGTDTGDGQIFINLVDNTRLDYGFTLIGTVTGELSVLDDLVEGEVIEAAATQRRSVAP